MKKLLLVLVLSMLFPIVSQAQIDREETRSVLVHFRVGTATLDEDYMDNRATLTEFAKTVKTYYSDTTAHFRQIRIVSSASPEGGQAVNDRLAKQRAEAITNWISREISAELDYAVESTGIDWDLLIKLIEESEGVPSRDEVLELLHNTPARMAVNGKVVESRYNALRQFKGGVPYKWIYSNIFPQLRYASARCEFWWEVIPELLLSRDAQRFGAAGGSGNVPYQKSVDDDVVPTVVASDSWIEDVVPTEEGVTFAVAPNPSTEPRESALLISCYGKDFVVPVIQDGCEPQLTITSSSTVNYPAEGATDSITFEKNVADDTAPAVRCSAEWIESIESTPEGIAYTVAENPSEESRTATIVVESYGSEHEVVVNQLGATPACKPFYMAIKTNMLYDIAAVPNIGAEFYLGKNFSIAANYAHAWWKKEEKNFYWRYYGADASIRWWFGKPTRVKPLQGHHIGVNYQILTYDFQLGKTGIMAGMPNGNMIDRANHIVALEYGYSLPIAERLNIDFTIAGGYHWGLFEEYKPVDGHPVWQATKRRQYFGPTKVEISLVWLIGCNNYNKDKGGKR
jgi:hypothetical protein